LKFDLPESTECLALVRASVWYAMTVATIPTSTVLRLIGREMMDCGGMGIALFNLEMKSRDDDF